MSRLVMSRLGRLLASAISAASMLACFVGVAAAQQVKTLDVHHEPARLFDYRPMSPDLPQVAASHPLVSVIEFARHEQLYLRQTVHDFTCRMVKRERIDGILQENHFVDMQVREEVRSGGQVVRPLAISLRFLAPAKIASRRVLFVAGQNDGKMLVRNGGKHFDYVVAKIDPDGKTAREESLVPITEVGFTRLLNLMISVLERHAHADPKGENTKVERIAGAKLNGRPCNVVRVTHPRKEEGLEFHVVNVFIDDELRVPVRVDYSDWPRHTGQTPPLLAEYTYTQLKLNVNLPANAFDPTALKSNR